MSANTSLPASNGTQYATSWVAEPNGRGTWGLFYSCFFTLSLCVYSAIHLNIPPKGEKERVQQWRMVKWVFIAVLAPEVALYSAWQQYLVAAQFSEKLYALRLKAEGITAPDLQVPRWKKSWPFLKWFKKPPAKDTNQEEPLPPRFSLTYGFYVAMGGLTADISDIYDNVSTITITPMGVLSMCETIPWQRFVVNDVTIRDKSKADNLAKMLVLFQVSWTMLQCISRQSSGLPLSVLEVHTMVHATCAMLMYALWFKKPLNIRDSTVLDLSAYADQLALEVMRSKCSAGPPFNQFSHIPGYDSLYHRGWPSSEAAMLVFDMTRLDSALENPPSTPAVQSIFDHQPETKTSKIGAASLAVVPDSEGSILPDIASSKDIPALNRSVADGVEAKQTLRTGDILWNGVGPRAHRSAPYEHFRWWFSPKTNAPELSTVDKRLEPLMENLLPADLSESPVWHQTTFHLSEKDLLRWQRAATAFARELSQRVFDQDGDEDEDHSSHGGNISRDASVAETHPLNNAESRHAAENEEEGGQPLREIVIPDHTFEHNSSADVGVNTEHIDTEAQKTPPVTKTVPRLAALSYHGTSYTASFQADAKETAGLYGTWGLRTQFFRQKALVRRSLNLESATISQVLDASVSAVPFYVLCLGECVYAGIHLSLWNHQFPSRAEMLLWKISGCALGGPFAALIVFAVSLYPLVRPIRKDPDHFKEDSQEVRKLPLVRLIVFFIMCRNAMIGEEEDRLLHKLASKCSGTLAVIVDILDSLVTIGMDLIKITFYALVFLIIGAVCISYVFSRCFLVVESFLALRLEPVGVYEDVTWPQYIPHF